jgi:GT2 family glycosyltransferase
MVVNNMYQSVSVSIVSHGHGQMVVDLVRQLLDCDEVGQVLVTHNVPEVLDLPMDPRVEPIHNRQAQGFGANHNVAFAQSTLPWFVVLNPDVTLLGSPFPALLKAATHNTVGIVSPRALGINGEQEDSWRQFPTLMGLIRKFCGGPDGRYAISQTTLSAFEVDWVSGLCMLFPREAYAKLNGFDERYFMYYEDVDICVRTWRLGLGVIACPAACLVHKAQRASRRNLRHMRWHAASLLRYLVTQSWRLTRPIKVNHG